MDQVRVGIVGTGWIARDHLRSLQALDDVTVTAVCDVDEARLQPFATDAGARAYTDWRRLFEAEELEAVFVCVPPLAHREVALEVLEAGLPIYLEKPIARGAEDAAAIVEAAERTGTVCAIGYQWHALDLLDDVRRLLADEEVGLLLGTGIGPTQTRPWFLDRRMGGGNLLERGSHHLDLARTVGGEVASVQAALGRVRLARSAGDQGQGDTEDAVTMVLELTSGAIATIVVAWTRSGQPATYSLDIVSSESTLHLHLDPEFTLSGMHGAEAVKLQAASHPFDRSERRFIDAARAGDAAAVVCRPRDAAATLAVALAAERALETGARVDVTTI